MKWSSAVSDNESLDVALTECAETIRGELHGEVPDLVVVFVSTHHAAAYDAVPELIREHLGDGTLIGCSGGGVIGAGKEVEHRPGLAVCAAVLPDVELVPFHVENDQLPDADAPPDAWKDLVGTTTDSDPDFLLIVEPSSVRSEHLVEGLDYAFPRSVKIGGLASGGHDSGGNALYLCGSVHRSGAVGLAISGDIEIETIVAQGCRPIGQTMQVTGCERNLLLELDGRAPLEVLRELFGEMNERDRELVQNSLFLGVVMDELNDSPQLGDFLIRNIIGMDPQRSALAIGEMLKEGQIVQFHLRDADTSSQDLDGLLTQYVEGHQVHDEAGALLFSCLGRGSYLYGKPDHDTDMFRNKAGPMPLTGFFCNGEIGPVGGATFLHGYTSSFGIFSPKSSR